MDPSSLNRPLTPSFSEARLPSGVLYPLGAVTDDAQKARNRSLSGSLGPSLPTMHRGQQEGRSDP